jgi:hypothetical protein
MRGACHDEFETRPGDTFGQELMVDGEIKRELRSFLRNPSGDPD